MERAGTQNLSHSCTERRRATAIERCQHHDHPKVNKSLNFPLLQSTLTFATAQSSSVARLVLQALHLPKYKLQMLHLKKSNIFSKYLIYKQKISWHTTCILFDFHPGKIPGGNTHEETIQCRRN